MKNFCSSLLLFILGSFLFRAAAQAPAQTANDFVRPYAESFQYGVNFGYYGGNWSDENLAGIAQQVGSHSVRPTLPEKFLETWGYGIRTSTFNTYVNQLGMKEITCFVEAPSDAHRDWTTYPGATEPSHLFAHLYEPIWNPDGTVNTNNYYASYLYKVLQTYGDKIRIWEIVNEPDFTYGASMDQWLTRPPLAEEVHNLRAPIFHYIRMLRISYEVIKKYRPDAYVTTGGVGYPQFVDALLRYTDNPDGGQVTAQYPRGAGAYLDALSFHSYPSYSLHYWDNAAGVMRYTRTSDHAAQQVMKEKDNIVRVLQKYGYDGVKYPAKHLIMTETNIGRRTSDDRTGSDEMQLSFGIKVLVLAQKQNVKQLYFFNLGEAVDAPAAGVSVSGSDEIGLMGFYENLNRVAPGAQKTTKLGQAFATTSKLLYGYQYDAARTAGLALPTNLEGAAFSKNGVYLYVLWAKALTDNSELASGTYSFPAAWNLGGVQRYEWNYAQTSTQTAGKATGIALTSTPAFFSEVAAPVASTPPKGGPKARITVTFASAPAAATARVAPTLYNKSRVLQFEEDDSPVSAFTEVYPVLKGGLGSNGQRYPGLRFSDGCGHQRPYTAAVAINGHNPFNNSVWLDAGPGHDAGRLVWAQAQELLDNGWDIENHSDLHTPDNPAQQVATLDALIASRLRGYRPAVHIVPTNFPGYCTAAFAAGYAGVSSASQSDNLPRVNPFNTGRVALSALPAAEAHFVYDRYNADQDVGASESTTAQLNRLKALSNNLLAASSNTSEVYVQRVFSHGLSLNVLANWLTHTQLVAQDRLWVTSLREFAEYRRVSSQVVKSETLSGNTLTIDLDYGAVSANTHFQNLSLLVDAPGATITNISVSGADSSATNAATKLINVFRHQSTTGTVLTATRPGAASAAGASLSVYPNPFQQQASIEFSLPQSGPATLALYNLSGQLVRQLFAGPVAGAAARTVPLPAAGLAPGLYVLRLTTPAGVVNQKLSCTGN